MFYLSLCLSVFVIMWLGFNKSFIDSVALSSAIVFLLLTFFPIKNNTTNGNKQTKEIWI